MSGSTPEQRRMIAGYIADIAVRFGEMDRVKADLYARLGADRAPKVNRKTLREECWFVWHAFTKVGRGKYSPDLPWSPAAIEARKANPTAALVIEHVEAFTLFCERLESNANGPVEAIEELLSEIVLVVVTKEEDALVSAAGFRNRIPESNDPWDRYLPAGLTRSMFRIPATGEPLPAPAATRSDASRGRNA